MGGAGPPRARQQVNPRTEQIPIESRAVEAHPKIAWSLQMKQIMTLTVAACLAITLFALNPASQAYAHGTKVGEIMLMHPWAKPGIPNRPMAAYLTLTNEGAVPDRLIAADSMKFRAVEIHKVEMQGAVMKMTPVDAIDLPAGGTVELAPGGYHLMLFGAATEFKEGDHFPMTLTFEKAGAVEVDVMVEKGGTEEAGHSHSGMTGN
jgi:copper(I)-binding protein